MKNDANQMKDLLVTLVTPLVNHPEEIRVTPVEQGNTIVLEVRVAPSDMGKVIGKRGARAQALRQVMKSYANRIRRRVIVDIAE